MVVAGGAKDVNRGPLAGLEIDSIFCVATVRTLAKSCVLLVFFFLRNH
jgi:hypothetical protein